jgi:hypothetical protein
MAASRHQWRLGVIAVAIVYKIVIVHQSLRGLCVLQYRNTHSSSAGYRASKKLIVYLRTGRYLSELPPWHCGLFGRSASTPRGPTGGGLTRFYWHLQP